MSEVETSYDSRRGRLRVGCVSSFDFAQDDIMGGVRR